MAYPINETVEHIGNIAIEGNIIPNEWYHHLRNENGKIQTNAALILADIVYWYRPVPIYDIKSEKLIGYGKKFQNDVLQLSYKYFDQKFGFTKDQTRNALIFLENKKLISREFRDIIVGNQALNNVLYICIYPEKIAQMTGRSNSSTTPSLNEIGFCENFSLPRSETQKISHPIQKQPNAKEKDWTSKYTEEQKEFLSFLLNIKPEVGDPIEKNHATWWIKHFGIEKIKIALEVYLQRVEKAKQDSTVPMPQHMGKYIRNALNNELLPDSPAAVIEDSHEERSVMPPCSEKPDQGVVKKETGHQKNEMTNTHISMISMFVNEVNDNDASMTFQKNQNQTDSQKNKTHNLNSRNKEFDLPSLKSQKPINNAFKKSKDQIDWKESFSLEEKKFLSYILNLKPEKGNPIEEKHATWWIKQFGVQKIKIAIQVYWQQVEKARKNSKIPMPNSVGAYVRAALDNGTQPCRESDNINKAFAENFKNQFGWSELTITEKYCRAEQLGKEWPYNLPENLFVDSLKTTFENFYGSSETMCFAV